MNESSRERALLLQPDPREVVSDRELEQLVGVRPELEHVHRDVVRLVDRVRSLGPRARHLHVVGRAAVAA